MKSYLLGLIGAFLGFLTILMNAYFYQGVYSIALITLGAIAIYFGVSGTYGSWIISKEEERISKELAFAIENIKKEKRRRKESEERE